MSHNSTKISYIYALVDPTSNLIRYVGQSVSPHIRYQRHRANREQDVNSYKYHWVEKLKVKGLFPDLRILECCSFDTINDREAFWIAHYREISGKKLTNFAPGGDKPNLTLEMIYKQSTKRQGRYLRNEGKKVSPFIGVSWSKAKNLWNAKISVNGKKINICYRENDEDAAYYYDAVALHFYGQKARTNGLTETPLTPKQVNLESRKWRLQRDGCKSGFMGVTRNKDMWVVRVLDNSGRRLEIGRIKSSKIAAAKLYDSVARFFDPEALTNFPGVSRLSPEKANLFCKKLTKSRTSSSFRGISKNPRGEFVGIISFANKTYTLCTCKKEDDAVLIYDAVARYFGKPTNLDGTLVMSVEEARKYSSEIKRLTRKKSA